MVTARHIPVAYGEHREYDLTSTRIRLYRVRPNERTGSFQGHNTLASVILAGGCFKTYRYENTRLSSGSVAAIKASNCPTEIIASERGVSWFHFELNDEHQYQINKATDGQFQVVRSSNPMLMCASLRLLRLLQNPSDDREWDCETIIDDLVGQIINHSRLPVRDSGAASQLRELIEASFDRSINVGTVSKQLGRNPAHLGRIFKRKFGCTPGEYIRRVRVCASLPLLVAGETILNTGIACGFVDESHYCRVFKKYSGYSPSAWRKRFGFVRGPVLCKTDRLQAD